MKRLLSLLFLLIFINGCGTVVSKNETKAEISFLEVAKAIIYSFIRLHFCPDQLFVIDWFSTHCIIHL